MQTIIPFSYSEDVIPPRCRKPRRLTYKDTLTIEVREVKLEDTQLAMIESPCLERPDIEIRWFDGRFWACRNHYKNHELYPSIDSSYSTHDIYWYETRAKRVASITEDLVDNTILIDGQVWKTLPEEPFYSVRTFGMGNNHGGTALFVEFYGSKDYPTNCFYAEDFDKAIVFAESVAIERGDTKDVPMHAHSILTIFTPRELRR